MMPMLDGERTAVIQTMLPEDPEDGAEFILPAGQTIGGANVINIWKGGKLLGATSRIAPIPNASGKYDASRVTSRIRLKKGDLLRIRGWQHNYVSIQFVEGFGWIGKKTTGEPTILMDKHMKVLHNFGIGADTPGFYLYERVCLEVVKGTEDETRSKSQSRNASRNPTTPGSGPSTPSRSDGSTRRPSPTPRERTNRYGKPGGRTLTSGDDE